ncbi:hypothetical protein N7507_001887 [Penicillium longicatenatum]|nr:hypothetical protein N7507_001887 [Penicillium longicatenatum]
MSRTNPFPADLNDEVNRAHYEASREDFARQATQSYVFVVAHEKVTRQDESEFIIEGVFDTLESANNKTMEIFSEYYPNYEPASFYAKGTWQLVGENSVGWYLSRSGTLSLEVHDHEGNTCRIYAEKHEIE